ncbi:MAG TPA: DNA/RNA nuclease SfsA [Geobacteraceae bacterium]|nr:DNA/RNA nuclease SfsA [Geobacteraceae bacterium]
MKLPRPLYPGALIRRYKRFLADVELDGGETVTAHCPNSGSMKGCAVPGGRVLLSRSGNPKRKLGYTWELAQVNGSWAGINTGLPNRLAAEAIESGIIPELAGYDSIRPEVKYGKDSRIDLLLSGPRGLCYVEVKNVTLVEGSKALFPDAETLRGRKHLKELMREVRDGNRGVIFFVVQRADARTLAPADAIDPEYGRLLRLAVKSGVEALAWQADVTPEEIRLVRPLEVILD